jgi:hypothetical protein
MVLNMNCEDCPFIKLCKSEQTSALDAITELNSAYIEDTVDSIAVRVLHSEYEDLMNSDALKVLLESDGERAQDLKQKWANYQAAYINVQKPINDYDEVTKELVDARQEQADFYADSIEQAITFCSANGPKAARRWKLFGRQVLKCNSPIAKSTYF